MRLTGTNRYPPDGYDELLWPSNHKWRQIAALLGSVAALGAIATTVIIHSGDNATTKATVGTPTPGRPVFTTPSIPLPAAPSSTPPLPPDTATAMTPPKAAPPMLHPRTVVYNVTGTKELLDLVTVVYTDAHGYPKTEFNVVLPWTKAVALNPGVQTQSVVATSFHSRLHCSIVNAEGQPVVVSTNNTVIATCTVRPRQLAPRAIGAKP
ncbi:threonine AND proline RICH protein [Mycobacterium lepromatosis]|uniref:Threonine and proline rich protein n=3 Tax=Mycobacterium lepromatosis TaxID=480418 RepID=A0A0F4ESH3_9MYCO|nr:hypothetical protein MLPM_0813 [Mycobacterium lepromatosis]UKN42100.1 threonine AND proline RICH protein [Mycobacterium lepromatosis]